MTGDPETASRPVKGVAEIESALVSRTEDPEQLEVFDLEDDADANT